MFRCSVDDLLAGVDPDYDRIQVGGAVGAVPAGTGCDIAVVAEGDALLNGTAWEGCEQQRPVVLGWVSRPGDLGDPSAYGIRIRGDSMVPVFRPNMIVIVSPALERAPATRSTFNWRLANVWSGCCTRPGTVHPPAIQSAHHVRLVEQGEVEAMHAIVYSRSIGPDDHAGDVDVGLMATEKTL